MLTPRQSEALAFIRQHLADKGFPPTSREIQRHFGFLSQNSAISILKALQRVGSITWTPNTARSIRLVEEAGNGQGEAVCPACGRVKE